MKNALASLVVLVMGVFLLAAAAGGAEPQEGAFGQVLDARREALVVAADAAWGTAPITVECRVKLLGRDQYNILVANETKGSPAHWEIFTTPGDGTLHAYLPGRTPDHAHTTAPIADGQWHRVGFVMEADRCRLFVDGVEKASVAMTVANAARVPGPLSVGALVEGGFGCNGLIDEVCISNAARAVGEPPLE